MCKLYALNKYGQIVVPNEVVSMYKKENNYISVISENEALKLASFLITKGMAEYCAFYPSRTTNNSIIIDINGVIPS